MVKSLGADNVIDYTSSDAISQLEALSLSSPYDLIIDAAGNSNTSALKVAAKKKILAAGGRYVSIDDDVPLTERDDFVKIKDIIERGKLVPYIDKCFPLDKIAEAHAYVDEGHKRGNVVITVIDQGDNM